MTSSCLHLHRMILFDSFENFAIRRKECHFCFASMSANGPAFIYNPTNQVIVLDGDAKEKGARGEHATQAMSRRLISL